jgi:hypothetical protein
MKFPSALDPIRSLQAAWKLLTLAPGPLLVGGIALALMEGGHCVGLSQDEHDPEWIGPPAFLVCCCYAGLVFFLISSWLEIGFARCVDETRHTGRTSFATLWDSRGRFGHMVLARLLAALIVIAAMLPIVGIVLLAVFLDRGPHLREPIPGLVAIGGVLLYLPILLYIGLGLSWVTQAVALEERAAVDALRRSWQLASGHRLSLLIFRIALVLFAMLGFCCCCVGYFLTAPLTEIARNEAFLGLTRDEARPILPAAPAIEAPPPIYPPSDVPRPGPEPGPPPRARCTGPAKCARRSRSRAARARVVAVRARQLQGEEARHARLVRATEDRPQRLAGEARPCRPGPAARAASDARGRAARGRRPARATAAPARPARGSRPGPRGARARRGVRPRGRAPGPRSRRR